MKKHFLILCLLGGISACGTANKTLNSATSEKLSTSKLIVAQKPATIGNSALKRSWRDDIGSAYSDDSKGFILTAEGGRIFAANESGNVYVFDQKTGKVIWNSRIKGKLSAGAGYGDGNVYVATDNGEVIALSQANGKELWRFQASSEVLSAPMSDLKTVVARSSDGRVTGLDATNGKVKWVVQRDLPKLSLRGDSPTLIYDDVAVIGLSSGTLLAIELRTGNVLWDLPVTIPTGSNALERLNDIYAAPVILGDILVTATYQGEIVAINIPNRKRLWSQSISTFHRLAIDSERVFVTDEQSNIIALDIKTGEQQWKTAKFLRRALSGTSVINNSLIVFGNEGDAYSLNRQTGKIALTHKINSGAVIGEPLALANGFIILSRNGKITAYTGL